MILLRQNWLMKRLKLFTRMVQCLILLMMTMSTAEVIANEERNALNRDQALLTKQLNSAEQVATVHGEYVVIRDHYLLGADGLLRLSPKLFQDIDAWMKEWVKLLEPLAGQQWVEALSDDTLFRSIELQRIKLEKLANQYNHLHKRTYAAYVLSQRLPKLSFSGFNPTSQTANSDALFLANYQDYLSILNKNIDDLRNLFELSNRSLQGLNGETLLSAFMFFGDRIMANLELLAKLAQLQFPELKDSLRSAEVMLNTVNVLNPVLARSTARYEEGLAFVRELDVANAESALDDLKAIYDHSFAVFESSRAFDPNRIRQTKAMVSMQISDLRLNLDNRIAAEGGRTQALRSFIRAKSTQNRPSNPMQLCREDSRGINQHRHLYDCNLFRKNVFPFLQKLNEIDYALLQEIEKNVRQVYQGPISTQ